MKKFEYKSVNTLLRLADVQLTNLGKEGWELINVLFDDESNTDRYKYLFKREINEKI